MKFILAIAVFGPCQYCFMSTIADFINFYFEKFQLNFGLILVEYLKEGQKGPQMALSLAKN